MSHTEFLYALQLIGEERYGQRARAALRAENRQATENTQNLEKARARIRR